MYFLQLDGAFLKSISSVVTSANVEREFLLIPSSKFNAWGDHFIYRSFSGLVSIFTVTFICGAMLRKKSSIGRIVGGITISLIQAAPLLLPSKATVAPDLFFLIVAIILAILAPVIGYFSGLFGGEYSCTKEKGIAGLPRWHLLWLWLPFYHYAILLISPFSSLIHNVYLSDEFSPRSIFAMILYLRYLIPVVWRDPQIVVQVY